MQAESEKNPAKPTVKHRGRLVMAALALGLVVAWGSDREAADATKPLIWHHPATFQTSQRDELRIASFNIHGGKGRDQILDLKRIATDLDGIDIAGLYEVHGPVYGMAERQSSQLGKLLQLNSLFLPTERRWWQDHFGNAILSSLEIEQVHRVPLPGTRGKAFRQAVLFDVPLEDQTVHVLMSHIDSQQDREPQLKAVIQLFHALQSPAILMGDLNSGPRDPRLIELLSQPGVTSVLDPESENRIDWIITRGLECVAAECLNSGASDHPVIKATLRLP